MSQYRLNLFIQPEHAKRLEELAAKKGVSKSSIVAAALASWLSPDAGDQREAIAEVEADSGEAATIKQMGNVMKVANAKAAGRADGKRLSTAVKAALN